MKYKVGDIVVIKPYALLGEFWKTDLAIDVYNKCLRFTDHSVIIKNVHGNSCDAQVRANGKGIYIADADILGYAFEYGDEIEVCISGNNWYTCRFSHYCLCDSVYSIVTTEGVSWKYARPIQKETFEVTVKRNGKLVDVKNLSDEAWMNILMTLRVK